MSLSERHHITQALVFANGADARGVLASIGIVKGQPFKPTDRQKAALDKAITTAPKMILAMRQLGRADGRNLYYKDRQYENAWSGTTSENFQETYLDIDQRAAYYQYAYSSASAMVMRSIGAAPEPSVPAHRLYRTDRARSGVPQPGRGVRWRPAGTRD